MSELTRDEVAKMEAGRDDKKLREMDAMIGKALGLDVRLSKSWQGDLAAFGAPGAKVTFWGEYTAEREWVEEGDYFSVDKDEINHILPEYTKDISAALDAYDGLDIFDHPHFELVLIGNRWKCNVSGNEIDTAYANERALAICKALLLATMDGDK